MWACNKQLIGKILQIHQEMVFPGDPFTYICTYIHTDKCVYVRNFSGHRLWRLSFLLFGHRQWRPLCFHFVPSHFVFLWAPPVATLLHISVDFNATFLCGPRLCQRGFLFCHRITLMCTFTFVKIGHRQWRPLSFHHISSHHFSGHRQWRPFHTHTHTFHLISSHHIYLGTACGDSVFCSVIEYICISLFPFHFIASFLWAPPVATQFLLFGHRQWRPLSFHCTDFIASFLWAPPVATQFSVLS